MTEVVAQSPGWSHVPGGRGGGESVSTGVSPVELVDCISTGYITVAMASCLAATWAHQGPAHAGWHSLPHGPGTFARSCERFAVLTPERVLPLGQPR